jgi:hypothetical protein
MKLKNPSVLELKNKKYKRYTWQPATNEECIEHGYERGAKKTSSKQKTETGKF